MSAGQKSQEDLIFDRSEPKSELEAAIVNADERTRAHLVDGARETASAPSSMKRKAARLGSAKEEKEKGGGEGKLAHRWPSARKSPLDSPHEWSPRLKLLQLSSRSDATCCRRQSASIANWQRVAYKYGPTRMVMRQTNINWPSTSKQTNYR